MQDTQARKRADRADDPEPAQTASTVTAVSQISDPGLSKLYAYWDGKRGGRRFPRRSDLDPVDIPSLLPGMFLVDVRRDPFDLFFRLAGTVLAVCYGSDVTGSRLIDLNGSQTLELYRRAADTVRTAEPVLVSGLLQTPAEVYRRADHLLLPLGDRADRVDMLVGGAIFRKFPIGERPEVRPHRRVDLASPGLSPDRTVWNT